MRFLSNGTFLEFEEDDEEMPVIIKAAFIVMHLQAVSYHIYHYIEWLIVFSIGSIDNLEESHGKHGTIT